MNVQLNELKCLPNLSSSVIFLVLAFCLSFVSPGRALA